MDKTVLMNDGDGCPQMPDSLSSERDFTFLPVAMGLRTKAENS